MKIPPKILLKARSRLKRCKEVYKKRGIKDHLDEIVSGRNVSESIPPVLPEAEMQVMPNLGCLNGTYINDIVSVNVNWPLGPISSERLFSQLDGQSDTQSFQQILNDFQYGSTNIDGTFAVNSNIPDGTPYIPFNVDELPRTISTGSGGSSPNASTTNLLYNRRGVNSPQPISNLINPNIPFIDNFNANFFENILPNFFREEFQSNPPSITNSVSSIISNRGTPFQSTVLLNSNMDVYSPPMVANGYTNVALSQEGLLWTLWPLSRPDNLSTSNQSPTYFNSFNFGTAFSSTYPIGQMAFFMSNRLNGCTPLGGIRPTGVATQQNVDNVNTLSSPILIAGGIDIAALEYLLRNEPNFSDIFPPPTSSPNTTKSSGITSDVDLLPGVETLNSALLVSTKQLVALVVIKVTEQIARVFNPAAGTSSNNRFIYLGYDGWSVVRTTANPVAPMSAQTYLSPQTVTGTLGSTNVLCDPERGNPNRDNTEPSLLPRCPVFPPRNTLTRGERSSEPIRDTGYRSTGQTQPLNHQVIFPPNFPQSIMFRNLQRTAPIGTIDGLFSGGVFATQSSKQ